MTVPTPPKRARHPLPDEQTGTHPTSGPPESQRAGRATARWRNGNLASLMSSRSGFDSRPRNCGTSYGARRREFLPRPALSSYGGLSSKTNDAKAPSARSSLYGPKTSIRGNLRQRRFGEGTCDDWWELSARTGSCSVDVTSQRRWWCQRRIVRTEGTVATSDRCRPRSSQMTDDGSSPRAKRTSASTRSRGQEYDPGPLGASSREHRSRWSSSAPRRRFVAIPFARQMVSRRVVNSSPDRRRR